MPDVWKPFNGSVSFVLLRHQTRWGLKCSTLAMGSSTLMVLTKRSGCVAINAKRLSICAVLLKRKKKISNSHSCAGSMSVDGRIIAPRKPASAGYKVKEQKWPTSELDRAFDLWVANKTKPKDEQMSKLAIAKEVKIPYTTICERLSGRRGGGKKGKISGGKRTPRVLVKGTQVGNFSKL